MVRIVKKPNLVTLVTAALIATVVRVFFYLIGGKEGSYLRESIENMGVTVVILEVCIVMLRFFTTFQLLDKFNHYIPERYELIAFTITGMTITFLWTTLPNIIFTTPEYVNDAMMYLTNRPFEPVPILVEYISLYLLNNKIMSEQTSLSILCMAMISVIIAISDATKHGNTIFPMIQNQSAVATMNPESVYHSSHTLLDPKEPSSLYFEDL